MPTATGSNVGWRAVPWSVWLVFGLCLVPELIFSGADFGLWASRELRLIGFDNFGFWAGLLGNWRPNYLLQPYLMFLTYGFLHAGIPHFALNMITLFSLGVPVARAMGDRDFLIIYTILLVAGGLGFAAFPEPDAPMVGASGALFGLAGIVLAWEVQRRRRLGQTLLPVLQSLAMLVVLNFVLWWAMNGQLAWQTHLGGFIGGWLAGYAVPPFRRS